MDDSSLPIAPAVAEAPDLPRPIAPWWHTAGFLLMLGAWASISGTRKHSYSATPHPITYISMMLMTWMLFGSVVAGIVDRRSFFFSTLRNKARAFGQEAARGFAIYLGFAFSIMIVALIVIVATRSPSPVSHPTPPTQTQAKTDTPLPPPAPASPDPFTALRNSPFHFDTKTQLAIAPSNLLDLLLWLAVSFTAGFCEEHIFRGYLLKQLLALTTHAGMSRLLAILLSVTATSLIFGSLHLYEGLGGALVIATLGAVYSVVALKLGNLRAVIIAHFLQDFIAGLFLFFSHGRIPH